MNQKINLRITRLHEASIYLLTLLSFATIATGTGSINASPILIAFPLLAVLSWFTHKRKTFSRSHAWLWNIIVLGALAFSAFEIIASPTADVIRTGIRFILILLLIKLFSRHAPRDDLQIYALTILAMAAATAVNLGLSYGILFGAYVLVGTFSIALFHLRSEIDQMPPTLNSTRMPFDRTYILVLTTISLAIFASSLTIFLTFPRVGLGFFTIQMRDPVQTTGFSEQVELGSHGVLRSNPAVVMRVEFPDGAPASFSGWRWRTMTFDTYDGRQWSRQIPLDNDETPLRARHGTFNLAKHYPQTLRMAGQQEAGLNMQIYLEPLGTNLLPVLWPTSSIHLDMADHAVAWSPRAGSLTVDSYGDLRHTFKSQIGITYQLTTYPKPSTPKLLEAPGITQPADNPSSDTLTTITSDDLARYLQLPDISPAIQQLANQITANATTPYAKADAIKQYFAQNFSYTTDLPAVDPDAPLNSFLFEARAGHCEYFATATVVLLRAANVPARLVNGFLGGAWNDVGNYLTVRQGDAHSWVEIFIPQFGWVPIDPTPASGESLFTQRPAASRWFSDTYDTLRMQWMKWIIEYNLETQIALVRSASARFSSAGRMRAPDAQNPQTTRPTTSITTLFPYLLATALGALLLYAALRFRRQRRQKNAHADLNKLFHKLEKIAARHNGTRRPRHHGPAQFISEFTAAVAPSHPQTTRDLNFFKDRYLAARFGNAPLTEAERRALQKALRRIQKNLKN